MDKLFIEPKTTALLLMDFQRMVVDSYAVEKEALLMQVLLDEAAGAAPPRQHR
jgi:hypothetical protein